LNPGRSLGRRTCYHYTNDAIVRWRNRTAVASATNWSNYHYTKQTYESILKKREEKKEKKRKEKTPGGTRTRNFQIRSLARYPIASRGQLPCKGIEPLTTRLKAVRSTD
tara:strand:+ start:1427 stop:1753 length:327 start_codon:yes stop_codon:yes gene_type:complete